MKHIAIIGAGNVGSALGKGWLKASHQVTFGVRDSESLKTKKALELIPDAKITTMEQACENADIIVIATPPEIVPTIVPLFGDLTHKTVIDTTNAIRFKPEPFPTVYHAVKQLGNCQQIVKCFNTTGFENMLDPIYNGNGIDMFSAGDDIAAKQVAAALSKDLGFETCYDFGGDDKVELLEKLALCWINIAIMQKHGRNLAFKLVKR